MAALAAVLSLPLPWSGPVRAERSVFFVAADEIVLPLSDDTMPFWEGGYLYICSAIFTDTVAGGAARRNLGISLTQNNDQDRVTLYREKDSLDFEMGVNFAVDPDGEIHYPGAVWRNGRVFVSAFLVADYFGLLYSVIAVEHGSLVWLRHRSFRLQEQAFADAASYQLNTSYQEYLDAKSPPAAPEPEAPAQSDSPPEEPVSPPPRQGQQPAPEAGAEGGPEPATGTGRAEPPKPESPPARPNTPVPPEGTEPAEGTTQPDTPDTSNTPAPRGVPAQQGGQSPAEEPEIRGGVELYLCFRAGAQASGLLDVLDAAGVRASFFCDRAFLEQQGDLVRRMAAGGHTVGLYLTGSSGEADGIPPETARDLQPEAAKLAEQAEAMGELTEHRACLRTRLAYVENGTEADREALRALGYACPTPYITVPLERREALLRAAGERGDRALVWLGDMEETSDLGGLLDAAEELEDRCMALTETSFP